MAILTAYMAETIHERRLRKKAERIANIDRYMEYARKWRNKNREKRIAYSRKWYSLHKDYWCNRRKNNPRIRLKLYMRTNVYLVGCSFEQLHKHLESMFRDGMTWENYGKTWHIDHIKPCCLFDLTDKQQQIACFNYTNLQPLLAIENQKKNKYYDHQGQTQQKEAPQVHQWSRAGAGKAVWSAPTAEQGLSSPEDVWIRSESASARRRASWRLQPDTSAR